MVRPLCIEARLGLSEQPSSNFAYAGRTTCFAGSLIVSAFLTEFGGTASRGPPRGAGSRNGCLADPAPLFPRTTARRLSRSPVSRRLSVQYLDYCNVSKALGLLTFTDGHGGFLPGVP